MATEETQVKPFYAGTQFSDWVHRNCHRCIKYNLDGPSDCEIDMALFSAYFEYGFIPLTIAKRMGYAKESGFEDNYSWDCPERSA